ncbi:vesicle transport protein USE1 [Cylas formicarius]|uniref:vesicle transport protein USE1 n=1 Tax=Cylas formicarius TaxID=197179 RepID=UPI0029588639|nr:vesicle transport protein USE1 [Cylas formicarius]
MVLSRQEINVRRLLARCELMCKSKEDHLEKYLESLEDMLQGLRRQPDVSIESIKNYQKRVMNLKGALGITTSKYDEFTDPQAMREDLLGLRHRNTAQGPNLKDLDQAIRYHEDIQKNVTEEMLNFAKTLKEQSKLANKIIRKDTEVVANSTQLTEQNFSKLSVESAKLAEHSKRAWKCWMWLILAAVVIVFINMVLFMKVAKKTK